MLRRVPIALKHVPIKRATQIYNHAAIVARRRSMDLAMPSRHPRNSCFGNRIKIVCITRSLPFSTRTSITSAVEVLISLASKPPLLQALPVVGRFLPTFELPLLVADEEDLGPDAAPFLPVRTLLSA